MVQVFVSACSMLATAVISAIFFDFHPTLSFACGFTIVCVSLYLYNAPTAHLVGNIDSNKQQNVAGGT